MFGYVKLNVLSAKKMLEEYQQIMYFNIGIHLSSDEVKMDFYEELVKLAYKWYNALGIKADEKQPDQKQSEELAIYNFNKLFDGEYYLKKLFNRDINTLNPDTTLLEVLIFKSCASYEKGDLNTHRVYLKSVIDVLYVQDPSIWLNYGKCGIMCVKKFEEDLWEFEKKYNDIKDLEFYETNIGLSDNDVITKLKSLDVNTKIDKTLGKIVSKTRNNRKKIVKNVVKNQFNNMTKDVNLTPRSIKAYLKSEMNLMKNAIDRFSNVSQLYNVKHASHLDLVKHSMLKVVDNLQEVFMIKNGEKQLNNSTLDCTIEEIMQQEETIMMEQELLERECLMN